MDPSAGAVGASARRLYRGNVGARSWRRGSCPWRRRQAVAQADGSVRRALGRTRSRGATTGSFVYPASLAAGASGAGRIPLRDRDRGTQVSQPEDPGTLRRTGGTFYPGTRRTAECFLWCCLLYTSDAADEEDSVDLGGR